MFSVLPMTSWVRSVVSLVLVVAATACARPQPAVTPDSPPPLEVPVVPPRVLAPLPEPAPPPAEQEAEPRPARPARPASRPETDRPAKPETTPETPVETPPEPAAKPPEAPPAVLQTPQTVDDGEAARRVREVLGRAERDLGRVNRAGLGPDARAQFDTARRFIDQAEGALKARNYVFATYLADKAETLARGLQGR